MTTRSLGLWLLILLGAATMVAAPARAAPGDVSFAYDWSANAQFGFEGFSAPEEADPDPNDPLNQPPMAVPLKPPYYAVYAGTRGRGFRLEPSPAADGTRDRVFPNYRIGDPSGGPRIAVAFTAPGTLEIRSATIQDVDFLNDNEGQILRFAYRRPSGATAFGFDFDRTSDPPGPFLPGVTYTGAGPVRLDAADALPEARKRVELSLRTICSQGQPENNRCPTVRFNASGIPTSTARVGRLTLELFDPEVPSLTATGLLAQRDDWTNSRGRRAVTLDAADPGSGIQRISLTRTGGGPSSTVLDRTVECDPLHRTSRPAPYAGNVCPDAATATYDENLGARRSGTTTYTATVTDLSGRSITRQFRLRIDREAPSATMGRLPSSLTARYSSRSDVLTVPVTGRDQLSGVSAIRITAGAITWATPICVVADCPRATSSRVPVDLGALPEGRVALKASAVDRAGNTGRAQTGGFVLLDRRPPGPVRGMRAARLPDGAVRVSWSAASDPRPGSGIDDYRYALFDAAGRRLRVGSTSSTAVRLRTLDGARTMTVRARDRAGLLGEARNATLPPAARPSARQATRRRANRASTRRAQRESRRNRVRRQRATFVRFKGKAKGKKSSGSCSIRNLRANSSGRTMRTSVTMSCSGKLRMTKAENCIKHREEGPGGVDLLKKDKVVKCHVRDRGRFKRAKLSVKADCDTRRFGDSEDYEATAYYEAPQFITGVEIVIELIKNHDEEPLRPKCDQAEPAARCAGDFPRTPSQFVVYLGYVRVIRYVGITRRPLVVRCKEHIATARSFGKDIRALTRLGPLNSREAHNVEQAVIESLGAPYPRVGKLRNRKNSISPRNDPDYCQRVARGIGRLRAAGYVTLISRRFPRAVCP